MQFDLVFQGGGAKGMVFVGAMRAYEALNCTYDRLMGTSAGAITATLLAAGYSSQEMLAALNERENGVPVFALFMGPPPPFTPEEVEAGALRKFLADINVPLIPDFVEKRIDSQIAQALADNKRSRHLVSLVERGGWFSAHKFVEWLQRKLDEGSHNGQPRRYSKLTLADFFAATGRELTLIATNTTLGRMLVLNHQTAPKCPLVWAVRMSMNIPFLWQEVIWQQEWGSYRGRSLTGHAIVDGGVLSNFPIELYLSDEPQVTAVMGDRKSQRVLGMLIDNSLPVPPVADPADELSFGLEPAGAEASAQSFSWQNLATVQRVLRLVNTMTSGHDRDVIEAFNHLVARMPAQDYGTTEFDMDDARKGALVAAGRHAMENYLPRRLADEEQISFAPGEEDPVVEEANARAVQTLEW
ncbi:MAG: patatin-like phospholipase family protein [Caldilineaceae bacterium]